MNGKGSATNEDLPDDWENRARRALTMVVYIHLGTSNSHAAFRFVDAEIMTLMAWNVCFLNNLLNYNILQNLTLQQKLAWNDSVDTILMGMLVAYCHGFNFAAGFSLFKDDDKNGGGGTGGGTSGDGNNGGAAGIVA